MYIAMTLVKKCNSNMGGVHLTSAQYRIAGVLYVFETKAAARELLGEDVKLIEVEFTEPAKAAAC